MERGEGPLFRLFVPFFFLFSLLPFSPFLRICLCSDLAQLRMLAPRAYHRGARAFLGGVAPSVRHGVFSLGFFFRPTVALRVRRTAYKPLDSGSGEGAEVTLVRHMTHGVSGLGRTKHIPFPLALFIHPT